MGQVRRLYWNLSLLLLIVFCLDPVSFCIYWNYVIYKAFKAMWERKTKREGRETLHFVTQMNKHTWETWSPDQAGIYEKAKVIVAAN